MFSELNSQFKVNAAVSAVSNRCVLTLTRLGRLLPPVENIGISSNEAS